MLDVLNREQAHNYREFSVIVSEFFIGFLTKKLGILVKDQAGHNSQNSDAINGSSPSLFNLYYLSNIFRRNTLISIYPMYYTFCFTDINSGEYKQTQFTPT